MLVENPTYVGALQALRPYRPSFVTLPMDDQGLQIEGLEQALGDLAAAGRRPKFLYTVANFQNPTGVTLAAERRHALLDLAERHGLPLVEDDPYGELRYSGEAPPLLAALDIQRWGEPHQVVYLSTFSKLLAPALRVGWAVGPRALLHRMVQVKQGLDLHTSSLNQAIAFETCRDGLLARQIPRICRTYHERRDTMLAELEQAMPHGTRWTRPDGGMFLWVTLPEELNASQLLGARNRAPGRVCARRRFPRQWRRPEHVAAELLTSHAGADSGGYSPAGRGNWGSNRVIQLRI